MIDLLRLVRAGNLLIAAVAVAAGGWIALGRIALPSPLAWAALSGVGLGVAGNVLNDILDVDADVVNRGRQRPIAGRRIEARVALMWFGVGAATGLVTAGLAGRTVLLVGTGALAVMVIYSPVLKPVPLLGNLAVAVVAGLPLMYGALAVGQPAGGVVPWTLAAALHFVREIVKDIEDVDGDRAVARRTLAVLLGQNRAALVAGVAAIAFVPLSFFLPWRADYGGAYFVIALPAQMAVLIAASWLFLGRVHQVSAVLKGAMVCGIAALVAGRLG